MACIKVSSTPNKVDVRAALYVLNGLSLPKHLGKKRLLKVAKWLEKTVQVLA